MKRIEYQLLMLFAALTFLGCSQDETTKSGGSESTESPVYFLAATNDAMTRGIAMPAGDLATTTTFRVYATQQHRQGDTPTGDITAFINPGASSTDNVVSHHNVNIYADNPNINPYYVGVWKTNKDYFWPQDTRFVNFYAVHPAEAPAIDNILTTKQIVFNGTTDALSLKGQYDLMCAKILNVHRQGYGDFVKVLPDLGDNSTVVLTFQHLLSRIAFYGKLSDEVKGYGWTVQIQDISICNVNVAGTLAFNEDATSTVAATLTPAATSTKSSVTMAMNTASHLTLTTTSVEQDADENNVPLTSPTDVAMLMPQTLAAWNPATEKTGTTVPTTNGGYLAIRMRIVDGDNHYHLGTASTYETVFVPFAINWATSKAYAYTLTFGLGLNPSGISKKQPITIECAIKPWTSTTVSGTATH